MADTKRGIKMPQPKKVEPDHTVDAWVQNKQPTIRCTFDFPRDTHAKLKIKCTQTGQTMRDFFLSAATQFLEE